MKNSLLFDSILRACETDNVNITAYKIPALQIPSAWERCFNLCREQPFVQPVLIIALGYINLSFD